MQNDRKRKRILPNGCAVFIEGCNYFKIKIIIFNT